MAELARLYLRKLAWPPIPNSSKSWIDFGVSGLFAARVMLRSPYCPKYCCKPPGPYEVLQTDETVKIPVCENTACTVTDFTLTYGTLQDFATEYKVTVGQIMGLNPGYNHSEAVARLRVLYDCTVLS